MSSVISTSVFTGTNGGTEHTGQSTVTLCAADALTGGNVIAGSVSYERWIALRVDTAPPSGATSFSITNTGSLPTGVSILFGVTDTPKTPVNTVSTIATMDLQSGRTYIFDVSTLTAIGQHTRYLVLQEVAAAGTAAGAINTQAVKFGWSEN